MDERKRAEIEYYDREAKNVASGAQEAGSLAKVDPFLLAGYAWLKSFFKEGYKDKTVLDYGCGTGVHLPWLVTSFRAVTGIDLSRYSLDRAQALGSGAILILGDCEKMPFPNASFDVVFDGGTFSSLDLNNALKEIHRILKPSGMLVGIETLGHNPITNVKRKLNTLVGKRTSWAASHIFKMEDLERVKKYFTIVDVKFFHLLSWVAFPLLRLPGGIYILQFLEGLEKIVITIMPFLKRYSFKIVFVFQKYA